MDASSSDAVVCGSWRTLVVIEGVCHLHLSTLRRTNYFRR